MFHCPPSDSKLAQPLTVIWLPRSSPRKEEMCPGAEVWTQAMGVKAKSQDWGQPA